MMRRVARDPNRHLYMDQALTPVHDDEDQTFDYLPKTDGAKAAIDHIKKIDELTHKVREPVRALRADLMPAGPMATPAE